MTYPLPRQLISDFAAQVERLIVLEELDPFLEEEIVLQGIPVEGKSIFPLIGEFDPQSCARRPSQAGLLPEDRTRRAGRARQGRSAAAAARAVPGLPASRRLLRHEEAEAARAGRHRLLHAGRAAAAERASTPAAAWAPASAWPTAPTRPATPSATSPSSAIRPSSIPACRRCSTPSTTRASRSRSSWTTASPP